MLPPSSTEPLLLPELEPLELPRVDPELDPLELVLPLLEPLELPLLEPLELSPLEPLELLPEPEVLPPESTNWVDPLLLDDDVEPLDEPLPGSGTVSPSVGSGTVAVPP